jgi:hypothetical protein
MDYEKEYKDALERAKYLKENTDSVGAKDISYLFEYIFPVLKESEEEKIKNRLIEFISCNPGVISDLDEEKALYWLEKQCEQKQDFNYHDYVCRDAAIRYLESIKSPHDVARQHKEEVIDWLNSLEKRIQPQHKQEWSEEDSRILYNVKAFIGYAAGQRGVKDELFKEANEWLNSLPIGFVHNENYNEDMVTLLVNELKQIARDNNAPKQYQAEIEWLKSLRPHPKQEWSEIDLDVEMISYYNEHFSPCENGVLLSEESGRELDCNDYESIARHFYELGLKARKDD